MALTCVPCNRQFASDQALQQHTRDSPAHSAPVARRDCIRNFASAEAHPQQIRASPAHHKAVRPNQVSFDMRPSLHDEVTRFLADYGISFSFLASDNSRKCVREFDSPVIGSFVCTSSACGFRKWTSKQVAITIRMYKGQKYNVRVYYQRCEKCHSRRRPKLDVGVYADRVAYRLAKWSGVDVEDRQGSGRSERPHLIDLCEGCRNGHCWVKRARLQGLRVES
ncbi:hypothetical protein CKM354_001296400 [Cercospora kikuchii]|uniref:C2H2-type domain-containing protein n=1 Tax=Cercospora kikuchii TaxID=84275 RepID=A0A9P3L2H9_9PEZI|nr:uncharacterized protein CKM354_001296400 [Cercospora kikuchii]GIZ49948.1 hypothetical protein CKM354_001296400 [Cercospora kikuchii]